MVKTSIFNCQKLKNTRSLFMGENSEENGAIFLPTPSPITIANRKLLIVGLVVKVHEAWRGKHQQ
jgi:hypothetical protein